MPSTNMSQRHSGNSAAFDEILSDLQNLILSLDSNNTKTNIRRIRKSRPRSGYQSSTSLMNDANDAKVESTTSTVIDSPTLSRANLRHLTVETNLENNDDDTLIVTQTFLENNTSPQKCTEMKSIMKPQICNSVITMNKQRLSGEEELHSKGESELSEYEPMSSYCNADVIRNTSPYEVGSPDSVFDLENEISLSYRSVKCNPNTPNPDKSRCTEFEHSINEVLVDDRETSPTARFFERIHRSSPVIGRKFDSDFAPDRSFAKKKSATLDGRRRIFQEDSKNVSKGYSFDEPYPSKTLSIKRVFSKKLSPFRRKPKLKSVKSLPVSSENSIEKKEGNKSSGFQLKLKSSSKEYSSGFFDSSGSDRSVSPGNIPYQRSISAENSSVINLENVQGLFFHKKRKNGKKSSKSPKSSKKNKIPPQEIDAKNISDKSEGFVEDDSPTCEDFNFSPREYTGMKEENSNLARNSSSVSAQAMMRERLQGSPIIRRSTIGSSYQRETGSSSQNTYKKNAGLNGVNDDRKREKSSKVLNRHSLHVTKDQTVLLRDEGGSRWSGTEDELLRNSRLNQQLLALENDKSFKGSSKPRSLFPKSMKSGNKISNMSSAERERTWNSTGKDPFIWSNLNGQQVEISELDLLSLSESECIALQKVAEQRLREIDLGVSITVPKDESKLLNGKNNSSVLRRAGVHLPLGGTKNKSKKVHDHVFSIPLVRVVENDQLLRLQTVEQDDDAFFSVTNCGQDNVSSGTSSSEGSPKTSRRMSSSIDSNADQSSNGSMPSTFESTEPKTSSPSTPPSDSPLTRRKQPGSRKTLGRRGAIGLNTDTEIDAVQYKLLQSLMISETSTKDKKRSLLPPTMPQVPYVVQKCCAHILKHGLDLTGIFRIAGSKKRVKQLRQEFDCGVDVKIDEDYHAHDVAALLKEFFRDLPEALLTRELYQAFISTAKLTSPQRLDALRCLVWLLPIPNRDTLQLLLSFLATVAEYAEDRVDANGKTVPGNKMSVANLSVIFGPNIMHRYKNNQSGGDTQQFQVQSLERAEESSFVIKIVDEMIRSQRDLFMIPRKTHDEILRTLQETDPEAVDFLLRRKAVNNYSKSPSQKFPTDRLESSFGEETEKTFPVESSKAELNSSDMNNNNKNSNSNHNNNNNSKFLDTVSTDHENTSICKGTVQLESPIEEVVMRPRDRKSRRDKFSSSPRRNGRISFTEEDLDDILQGDSSSLQDYSAEEKSPSLEKLSILCRDSPSSKSPKPSRSTNSSEKRTEPEPANSCLKTEFPRKQPFSVAPQKYNYRTDFSESSLSPKSPLPRPRSKRSPVHNKPTSQKFVSDDSLTKCYEKSTFSRRPPTPKQGKHFRIHPGLDPNESGFLSDSEATFRRKRLDHMVQFPSKNPHVSASNHVEVNTEKSHSDVSGLEGENVIDIGELVPRTYRRIRRGSRDDLYLTDIRRRLERQRSIMI